MAKITLNDKEIKKMSKTKFLKQHARLADKMDLVAYYDNLKPKKKSDSGESE